MVVLVLDAGDGSPYSAVQSTSSCEPWSELPPPTTTLNRNAHERRRPRATERATRPAWTESHRPAAVFLAGLQARGPHAGSISGTHRCRYGGDRGGDRIGICLLRGGRQ